jgi:hypothetical protein
LFTASRFTVGRETISIDRPGEMAVICALYFLAGIGLIALRRVPFGGLRALTLTHSVVDSAAMGFVLWAAGGVASGLGILLLLPVAAMALLAYHRDAFFTPRWPVARCCCNSCWSTWMPTAPAGATSPPACWAP